MGELLDIELSKIRANKVALRDVKTDSETYMELVDSIRDKGVLNAITVRRGIDEETKEEIYEIIDGLHRFTASKDAGRETVPAQVLSAGDAEVLELQIVGNLQKVETKASEYTTQLRRMLNMHPMMTLTELAKKVCKSISWVNDRLSLKNIKSEKIMSLIDSGDICLANAFVLAKLPEDEQTDWVQDAIDSEAGEFVPRVQDRLKEIRDAQRKGREAQPLEFTPIAHLRKVSEFKDEMESGEVASILVNQCGISDPIEAFKLAVQWALNMDPASLEAQKVKWEQKEAEKAERKKKREAEKAAKKLEKAKKAQAEAEEELAAQADE